MGVTGSKWGNLPNSFLRWFVTFYWMLAFYFYSVNHISSHVIEGSEKSSYSFLEFFLWIISLCHVRYLKLKPRRHWSQKYSFLDILIIRPEVEINLPIKWSNWLFLSSLGENGHVTHHFESNTILITISTYLLRKINSETKNREINNFWIFF